VGRLSDEELRALELDEKIERVDLLDYEASKQKLAEIHQAEAKREAAISGQAVPKMPRKRHDRPTGRPLGRPKQSGSRRDVAERTGMDPAEQRRTERHSGAGRDQVLSSRKHPERLPVTGDGGLTWLVQVS
jgi:hypothetical protein